MGCVRTFQSPQLEPPDFPSALSHTPVQCTIRRFKETSKRYSSTPIALPFVQPALALPLSPSPGSGVYPELNLMMGFLLFADLPSDAHCLAKHSEPGLSRLIYRPGLPLSSCYTFLALIAYLTRHLIPGTTLCEWITWLHVLQDMQSLPSSVDLATTCFVLPCYSLGLR